MNTVLCECEERLQRGLEIASGIGGPEQYRENLIGTTLEVLFEEPEGDFFTGHAPNYVKVYAQGENLHNAVRSVKITGLYQDGLLGELI